MSKPPFEEYAVIVDEHGCPHCKSGRNYTVTARSTGIAIGTSSEDEDAMEDLCGLMNMAYDEGYAAAIKMVSEG